MSPSSEQYNFAAIRSLLQSAFAPKELWRFCADRPSLRDAIVEFGMNSSLAEMADVLLEYCQTRLLLDELLAAIRDVNPRQYERYQDAMYGSGPLPSRQIPHNLPPRSEFVGREKEKARAHEALCSRWPLISIEGIGGIGKTALALEVAYECLHASQSDEPPDGIVTFGSFVWTTARDRDLTLNALLDAIALTLDYPGIMQRSLDQKCAAVEKLLRAKSCLLIVDNFETISDDQVREFLIGLPEPSKALLTTREQKLGHAWTVPLKGLEQAEAFALIRGESRRLALPAVEKADDQTLVRLYEATGGAPLALKWAAGQIKQRGQSLDTVLSALHGARGSIFEEVFSRSWGLLPVDAREVLMAMPLFAASASRAAVEAASNVCHFALDEALGRLVEMSLLDATDELQPDSPRYSTHPLTRTFASIKGRQELAYVGMARQRLAEYFLEFVHPYRGDQWHPLFAPLELDLPNIVAVVRWCLDQRYLKLGAGILGSIRYFMISRGHWNDLFELSQQAIFCANEQGDELLAAEFQGWPITWLHQHRGDLETAEQQALQALRVFEKYEQKEGIARTKRSLARIASEQGDWDRAESLFRESLLLYESPKCEREYYRVRADLAHLSMQRGDLDAAYDWSLGALEAVRRLGDPERVAHLLAILSGVARRRGDLEEAEIYGQQCLDQARQIDRLNAIADNLFWLAMTEVQMGKRLSSRLHFTEALETYRRLDMHKMIDRTEKLLAELGENPTHD